MSAQSNLVRLNPYETLASFAKNAVSYVGANKTTTPLSTSELVFLLGTYVDSIEYSTTNRFEANLMNTRGMAAYALNGYEENIPVINGQSDSITELLNLQLINNATELIANLEDIQRRGYSCNMSYEDQRSLQIGAIVGQTLAAYWNAEVVLGGSSDWSTEIGAGGFKAKWVRAGVRGAILYSQKTTRLLNIVTAAAAFTMYDLIS